MILKTPVAIFLLIQGDKVVDHCVILSRLKVADIDSYAGFKIAVGCHNEWGEKEVIGVIADVAPLSGCRIWSVTPMTRGCSPFTVSARGTPAEFVKHRMHLLTGKSHLDLTNLPATLTIKPAPTQVG